MEKRENSIPHFAWTAAATLAPLAIAAPGSGWVTNLTVGLLGAALAAWTGRPGNRNIPWVGTIQSGWIVALLLYYLGFLRKVWEGSSGVFAPVCLLLIGLWGIRKGHKAAAGVGAVLLRFALPLFGTISIAALEDTDWRWALKEGIAYEPSVIVAYLIPRMMLTTGEKKTVSTKWYLMFPITGVLLSLIIRGIVPDNNSGKIGMIELSRSVEAFGRNLRLEAIAAMALTISMYCFVSIALSMVGRIAVEGNQKGGAWVQWVIVVAVIAGLLCKITISANFLAIGTVICWVILPGATQLIGAGKKLKNNEKGT